MKFKFVYVIGIDFDDLDPHFSCLHHRLFYEWCALCV